MSDPTGDGPAAPASVDILPATPEDAEEILALQYLAFAGEAGLYDQTPIPPLVETVREVRADITGTVVLKACLDGRIVGSVRGRATAESGCFVSRLMVHPEWRRQGIGTRLMAELESHFPHAAFAELLVDADSERNVGFYLGLGYEEVGRLNPVPRVTLLRMRKPSASAGQ